jgi:hypothetical protein
MILELTIPCITVLISLVIVNDKEIKVKRKKLMSKYKKLK